MKIFIIFTKNYIMSFLKKSLLSKVILYFILIVLLSLIILISNRISNFNQEIVYRKKVLENNIRNEVKKNLEIVFSLMKYNFSKGIEKEEFLDILRILKKDKFYFFVISLDGKSLVSENDEMRAKEVKNLSDEDGFLFVQEMIDLSNKYGEGFVEYKFKEKETTEIYEKVSFVKKFGAWNIIIGTGKLKNEINDILDKNKEILYGHLFIQISLMLITFFGLLILVILILKKKFVKPILLLKNYLDILAKGNLPNNFKFTDKNEIKDMIRSINILTNNLKNTRKFALEVGKGNFKTSVNVFGNKGDLGKALVEMKDSLHRVAKEKEKQEIDEENRNWSIRGLAKFGDILRENNSNMEDLSYIIIKNLIHHMKANQGAFFVINKDDENNIFIELVSAFAYKRRKKLDKNIKLNEGLVGICVVEGKTTYLTELPDDYINITSGLGDAPPNSLLIVPLKLNDEIYGVVEIASFDKFEKFEIDFVEKIGENIASKIANVKINFKTKKLLRESEEKTKEMKRQEEKMRQTLEALQISEKQAHIKEEKLIQILRKTRKNENTLRKKLKELENKN